MTTKINVLLFSIAVFLVPVMFFRLFSIGLTSAAAVTIVPDNSQIVLAGDEITFTYTATNAVEAIGTTYDVIVSPSLPSALSNCAVATAAIDSTSGGAGSFSGFTVDGATFTTTTATTTTGRELCLTFPTETDPASYSVMISSSTGDFGLSMVHYADNNVVNISATVGASLSFNIVDLADTAEQNTCQLGNVTTLTAVDLDAVDDGDGECGYGLAIGTNAANGFTVQVVGSANGLYNGTNTMNDVVGAFNAGTEEYGFANVTTPAGITADAAFTGATGYAIPTTAADIATAAAPFTYTSGVDDTDIIKILHGLTVGTGTDVGSYTQTVTYTAVANF